MNNEWTSNKNIRGTLLVFLAVVTIFFAAKTISAFGEWGRHDGDMEHTISVAGYGEVASVPDAASFTYSVVETGPTVADAQAKATTKSNAIVAYLKEAGIEDKDVRTENYNINPQYEYKAQVCTQFGCPGGRQTIVGYEVNQAVTVKVRDTAKAGDVLSGIGTRGASNVSGLSFTIDQERQEELKAEARKKAIEDARSKAEKIAKSLGVSIDDVVAFNEDMGGPVYPMFSRDAVANESAGAAVAPVLPTGENKIISTVSVTFEIE